jgi:hypothetical protein
MQSDDTMLSFDVNESGLYRGKSAFTAETMRYARGFVWQSFQKIENSSKKYGE